ncbi:hypothetical protein FA95DRAFT_1567664 [Auriscalpium vulgare]|uniref:Uncharacterized protein n=1 Tax=Auriscalpium vulgare TaxID=40419 RepID=A0ACB8R3D6_9AGAM|nr:hypothetical protein FA95DRAFT_1567664 [Auriscalpium vulgare]
MPVRARCGAVSSPVEYLRGFGNELKKFLYLRYQHFPMLASSLRRDLSARETSARANLSCFRRGAEASDSNRCRSAVSGMASQAVCGHHCSSSARNLLTARAKHESGGPEWGSINEGVWAESLRMPTVLLSARHPQTATLLPAASQYWDAEKSCCWTRRTCGGVAHG